MRNLYLYLFCAFFVFFQSCTSDDGEPQIDPPTEPPMVTAITLSVDKSSVATGESVNFTVTTNLNTDVTSSADIYVDGSLINGQSYTSMTEGSFESYAIYDDITSNNVNVTYANNETEVSTYKRNVLVEYFTGTWCGNCPRVSYSLGLVNEQSDYVIPVAAHSGSGDPYVRVDDGELRDIVNYGGVPTSAVNRGMHWQNPESENISQITDIAGTETNVGLKINSSYNNVNMNAEVSVNFSADMDDDMNIVVYLLEDGLIHSQANYFSNLYGGQNPIPDFEHNNVLTDVFTSFLGDDIQNPQSGVEQSFTFTKSITESLEDPENAYIVAFVYDESTNTCLNVQRAKLGELVDYQLFN